MPLPPPAASAWRWPRSTRRPSSSISTPSSATCSAWPISCALLACACARTPRRTSRPIIAAQADRARRGRGVLPEGVRGRGDGRRRHRRRARLQRGGGRGQARPARRAGAACQDRRVRRRCRQRGRDRGGCGKAGASLDVLVEIDVGGRRCGTLPGAPARANCGTDRALCASALCRPAGLSRLGPARARGARAQRAASPARWRTSRRRGALKAAACRLPIVSRRRHRDL